MLMDFFLARVSFAYVLITCTVACSSKSPGLSADSQVVADSAMQPDSALRPDLSVRDLASSDTVSCPFGAEPRTAFDRTALGGTPASLWESHGSLFVEVMVQVSATSYSFKTVRITSPSGPIKTLWDQGHRLLGVSDDAVYLASYDGETARYAETVVLDHNGVEQRRFMVTDLGLTPGRVRVSDRLYALSGDKLQAEQSGGWSALPIAATSLSFVSMENRRELLLHDSAAKMICALDSVAAKLQPCVAAPSSVADGQTVYEISWAAHGNAGWAIVGLKDDGEFVGTSANGQWQVQVASTYRFMFNDLFSSAEGFSWLEQESTGMSTFQTREKIWSEAKGVAARWVVAGKAYSVMPWNCGSVMIVDNSANNEQNIMGFH